MAELTDPVAHNRAAWDRLVELDNEWTRPVSPDVIIRARAGDWSVVLIGYEPTPREWLPADLRGVDMLCLAAGGGQQGPVLAAAGATVTVFDNSPRQLNQDRTVAAREGLQLRTVLGDMRDLSAFADGSFDLIFHPVSNLFCPELAPVWRECFRVLRPAGTLLSGFMNPDLAIFDTDALDNRGELVVHNTLPHVWVGDTIEYSHTMTDQIGGQLTAGFVLTGFAEAPHHQDATARYMPGYFATRAVKPA
jgi:SAM-dependent methyltransferase